METASNGMALGDCINKQPLQSDMHTTQQPYLPHGYGSKYPNQPLGYPQDPTMIQTFAPHIQNGIPTNLANQMPLSRDWNSGLCACFDDMGSCCCGLLCPECYTCSLYSRYNEDCCAAWIIPVPIFPLRVKHRTKFQIHGSLLCDCCASVFCTRCIICQIKRDMDYVERQGASLKF